MNKFKLSLALFAAYAAGEAVTTVMQIRKLDKALKTGVLFQRTDVAKIKSAAYVQGIVDGLSDPEAVQEQHSRNTASGSILDYTNV